MNLPFFTLCFNIFLSLELFLLKTLYSSSSPATPCSSHFSLYFSLQSINSLFSPVAPCLCPTHYLSILLSLKNGSSHGLLLSSSVLFFCLMFSSDSPTLTHSLKPSKNRRLDDSLFPIPNSHSKKASLFSPASYSIGLQNPLSRFHPTIRPHFLCP